MRAVVPLMRIREEERGEEREGRRGRGREVGKGDRKRGEKILTSLPFLISSNC
jgi:hypothetical protein